MDNIFSSTNTSRGKPSRGKPSRTVKSGGRRRLPQNTQRNTASKNNVTHYDARTERKKRIKAADRGFDFSIFFIAMLLVLFGIVMVFSSSYYYAMTTPKIDDMYHFLKRQAIWAAAGTGAMIFMMNFDYHLLKKFASISYIVSCILLLVVLFTAPDINGSRRWIYIIESMNIGFQPSEVAKLAVILFLSKTLSENRKILDTFKGFVMFSLIVLLPVGLIVIENMSTAIIVAFVGFVIMFVASPKIWHFIIMLIPVSAGGVIAVTHPAFKYRGNRVTAWLDPFSDPTDTGYQIVQSLYAIGSGGLFGLGLGESRQKLGYIPEAYNDIIFSVICEELGMFGALILIGLFMALVWRGVKVAINARDTFGSLLATGIIAMIAVQVLINIAVVTNTIPATGIPLPLISYGGSSLLLLMLSIGVLLNISKYSK